MDERITARQPSGTEYDPLPRPAALQNGSALPFSSLRAWWRSVPLRSRMIAAGWLAGVLVCLFPLTEWHWFPGDGSTLTFYTPFPVMLWGGEKRIDYGALGLSLAAVAGLTSGACVLVGKR